MTNKEILDVLKLINDINELNAIVKLMNSEHYLIAEAAYQVAQSKSSLIYKTLWDYGFVHKPQFLKTD